MTGSYKAVGIHVFAGGFTCGVKEIMQCDYQLETHGFGGETAKALCGVESINAPAKEWPNIEADFAFGNPRCTGFSTITSGYDESAHGPWAKVTCDIHEFCDYVIKQDYPIAIWESVQQAYSTGKPLLDFLRDEKFKQRGYRIAHVFVNASSVGNSQQRKRYFFVAYKGDKNFNIEPPQLPDYQSFTWDMIGQFENDEYCEIQNTKRMLPHEHVKLTNLEYQMLDRLGYGQCMNSFLKWHYDRAPKKARDVWDARLSDLPFSLHCLHRISYCLPTPTLHSSSGRALHPVNKRPLLLKELAAIMGWPSCPEGTSPAEIAKGVVPAVGTWLAEQAVHYLNDVWGKDDWESTFNAYTQTWEGRDTTGEDEKVFNLTYYLPPWRHYTEYPEECFEPRYWNPNHSEYRHARKYV